MVRIHPGVIVLLLTQDPFDISGFALTLILGLYIFDICRALCSYYLLLLFLLIRLYDFVSCYMLLQLCNKLEVALLMSFEARLLDFPCA